MCGRPPSRAPKVRARRKVPATPQAEFSSFRSRCFALEGVDGEVTQRAKRDRTGSNSEKPEEDGASSETRAQRHSEQPGLGAHALPSPGRVLPHLRVPCDSARPSRAARSSGTSAPSDDQPRAQGEARQRRQKFAEPVLSSVFPASRACGKPQHYLPVRAEPGGRCSAASGECLRVTRPCTQPTALRNKRACSVSCEKAEPEAAKDSTSCCWSTDSTRRRCPAASGRPRRVESQREDCACPPPTRICYKIETQKPLVQKRRFSREQRQNIKPSAAPKPHAPEASPAPTHPT